MKWRAGGSDRFLAPAVKRGGNLHPGQGGLRIHPGYGLLQREPWARVIALVLGFLSLFNIPFGTAVGVYTMWVLLPAQSQEEYDALWRLAPHSRADAWANVSGTSSRVQCLPWPSMFAFP